MKYELVVEEGTQLKRIKAIRDIPKYNVRSGDFGGYVASESNLSQEDDAWIFGNAVISDDAVVSDNAWVSGNAKVSLGKYICCIGVADGWWKSLVNVNGVAYIQAGCQSFNLDDAYVHWANHVEDRALTLALLESAKSIANLLGLSYR